MPLPLQVQQPHHRETEPRSCLPQLRAGQERTRVLWQMVQYGMSGSVYCVVKIVESAGLRAGLGGVADGAALNKAVFGSMTSRWLRERAMAGRLLCLRSIVVR